MNTYITEKMAQVGCGKLDTSEAQAICDGMSTQQHGGILR